MLLVAFLFSLSAICGYLLSKPSLTGKVGITLFYKEYGFLKTWWQGGLVVFIVLLLVFGLQAWAEQKLLKPKARVVFISFLVAAFAGFYATYFDFKHTTTHRWLGQQFHLGAYLFWGGWIITCIFFLLQKEKEMEP